MAGSSAGRGDDLIELTDLLIDIGPDGVRRSVRLADVLDVAVARGDRWGERILRSFPTSGGMLDDEWVDRVMVAVHVEIQRLSEEFRHGARMAGHLVPVLEGLRRAGHPPPYRIVDVGCGTGYVIRWLAANLHDPDVELVGVDLDPALVAAARSLAATDGVRCRFEVADAFALDEPATVLCSTGVAHHFRGDDLGRFFASHERSDAAAFVHVDFQPSRIAPIGAWLFHHTRMRLAISRHDGVRSAQRAHPTEVLAAAATAHAPRFETWLAARRVRHTPFPCVLTTLVGVDRPHRDAYLSAMGRAADRLEPTR